MTRPQGTPRRGFQPAAPVVTDQGAFHSRLRSICSHPGLSPFAAPDPAGPGWASSVSAVSRGRQVGGGASVGQRAGSRLPAPCGSSSPGAASPAVTAEAGVLRQCRACKASGGLDSKPQTVNSIPRLPEQRKSQGRSARLQGVGGDGESLERYGRAVRWRMGPFLRLTCLRGAQQLSENLRHLFRI